MNTQEVIELLNLQEIQAKQEVVKKYQVDKATVIRVHTNDKYDLSNGMVNIQPMDTSKKFSAGDSVFLQIPLGDKQQTKIVARSNIKIPDEELYEYGEEPVEEGTIYLSINDYSIKNYSLSGVAGEDIYGSSTVKSICCGTDGYIYYAEDFASAGKISVDGNAINLNLDPPGCYYNYYGLAVDTDCSYIYSAGNGRIARASTSTGIIEINWKEITETSFDDISDLCSDTSYLYALGRSMCGASRIAVYDFAGNFQNEIYTLEVYEKITSDGVNLYLSNDSRVDIYTISGTFVRSILETGIRTVAVKDGKLYIVTESSEGG